MCCPILSSTCGDKGVVIHGILMRLFSWHTMTTISITLCSKTLNLKSFVFVTWPLAANVKEKKDK